MCVLSIKVPIRKKSENLFNDLRKLKKASLVLVFSHNNHCLLFNAKSSLYIHIRYISFGLVVFYGIRIIIGYFMPNSLYTSVLKKLDLVWLCFMTYQPLKVI